MEQHRASMHYPLGIFLEDRMYNLNHYSNMTYNCLSNYNNVQMNSIEWLYMLCKFHFLLGNYHRMKCIQCQIYNHYNELNKLHRSYYLNNGLFCIMNNYWRKFHITSKMDRSFHILNHQDNIHFCKINNLCFLHLNNLHMDVHKAGN